METLQRTANRGSISTGFDIENSLKLEADNSESMSRTPSSNGNLKTCTLSVWLKRTELKDGFYFSGDYGGAADPWFILGFVGDGIYFSTTAGVSGAGEVRPNRVFRDTSAWYHIVVACDTTQSTAADRVKMYINGVQETSFLVANYPNQNDDLDIMAAKAQGIGGYNDGVDYFYSGYMSEFVGIDGQQLDPTSFGEFDSDSGIWIPKDVSDLTFGTNGFYLDFEDASNLGNDASGGTDFAETNITAADQATDTPTNNFATWQVLTGQPYAVIRNGATHYNLSGQVGWYSNVGSIAFTKGKWYAEFRLGSGITNMMAGVSQVESEQSWNNTHLGGVANSTAYTMGFYNANGNVYTNNGSTAWGSSFPAGTIIMVAVDYKTSGVVSLYFGTNGTWANSSNPETGANNFDMNSGSPLPNNLAISFAASPYNNGGNAEANFGGFSGFSIASGNTDDNGYGTFEYAPPSGYYALCTKNLAEYG